MEKYKMYKKQYSTTIYINPRPVDICANSLCSKELQILQVIFTRLGTNLAIYGVSIIYGYKTKVVFPKTKVAENLISLMLIRR